MSALNSPMAVMAAVHEPVPAFLQKLWAMICDRDTDGLISWSENGESFVVKNTDALAQEVLPKYFKHRNFSSLVRQLNLYNFIRTSGLGTNAIISSGNVEFCHPDFRRGEPKQMAKIKRKGMGKPVPASVGCAPSSVVQMKALEHDTFSTSVTSSLEKLQQQQEQIMTTLQDINRDNRGLWTEMLSMRRSVQRHEVIIEKLVKFIAHLFKGSGLVGQKRKRFAFEPSDALAAPAKRPVSPTLLSSGTAVSPPESATKMLLEDLLAASGGAQAGSAGAAPSSLECSIPLSSIPADVLPRESASLDVVAYTGNRTVPGDPTASSALPLRSSASATSSQTTGVADSRGSAAAAGFVAAAAAAAKPLPALSSVAVLPGSSRNSAAAGSGGGLVLGGTPVTDPYFNTVTTPTTSGDSPLSEVLDSGGPSFMWPAPALSSYDKDVLEENIINVDQGIDQLLQQFTSQGVPDELLGQLFNADLASAPTFDPGLLGDSYEETVETSNLET